MGRALVGSALAWFLRFNLAAALLSNDFECFEKSLGNNSGNETPPNHATKEGITNTIQIHASDCRPWSRLRTEDPERGLSRVRSAVLWPLEWLLLLAAPLVGECEAEPLVGVRFSFPHRIGCGGRVVYRGCEARALRSFEVPHNVRANTHHAPPLARRRSRRR